MNDTTPYYFFLSYAREDATRDHSGTIETFHRDLEEAVRVRTNWPHPRIGFIDRVGLEPGTNWPDRLSEALGTCRSFVPILSPAFFDREFCGKEWAVFANRLSEYNVGSGEHARLIHPVQLVAGQHLIGAPAAISEIQRTHATYPADYNDGGLRQLTRVAQGAYPNFVEAFAEQLVGAVQPHELPPSPVPDIRTVDSTFQRPGTQLTATLPDATPTGPRFAQFFFVAARRDELEGVRQNLQFYGAEGGLDWQPYLPDLADEVAIIAQEVALQEKLRYESVPLDERFAESLEQAVQRNKIVVVFVDSWTVRLERYREFMKQLDARDVDNCIVVIPWNPNDLETAEQRTLLADAIGATFITKARRRDPHSFVDSTASYQQLKDELAKSLVAVRARILESGDVVRRAEASGVFIGSPPAL